jgi:N-acetylglucosamine kinase-like BadF-type ATPase
MSSTQAELNRVILGVDGGGTKTEAWLARAHGGDDQTVIGRGRSASSNPRAVGMERALVNLGAAIDAAWADAGLAASTAHTAVLAMSGAGHLSVQEQIRSWADQRGVAHNLVFKHDAEPVLAAGTPEGWGIALIVGTGSAAIGCGPDLERKVVGGWGYHYGDEGSAYWIGRCALEAVARAADGRAAPTQLTPAILGRLNVDEPRSMLGALEATGNVRGAIAALADAVEAVARNGDATATQIVDDAAEQLTAMIEALGGQLSLGSEFPLALAGGVVCGSELLRNRLLTALQDHSLNPRPMSMVPHPVAGCLRIAAHLAPGQ